MVKAREKLLNCRKILISKFFLLYAIQKELANHVFEIDVPKEYWMLISTELSADRDLVCETVRFILEEVIYQIKY